MLKMGKVDDAKEILESERANNVRRPALENLKRAESLMNQQLQRISASTTLSGEEKRARLDQFYARRNRLAEQFKTN